MTHKAHIYKFGNTLLTYLKDPNQVDYFAVLALVCMVGVVSFFGGVLYGLAFTGW